MGEGWEALRGDHVFTAVCFMSLTHSRTTTLRFPPCYDNVNVDSKMYRMIKGTSGKRGGKETNISKINGTNVTAARNATPLVFSLFENIKSSENARC